jgi:hypothetical protein
MDDDLIQLLIYFGIILVGVFASAVKNSKKKQQQAARQIQPKVPRTFTADPGKDFGPDLRPLLELFDIPVDNQGKSVEDGPSVEEAGMMIDTQEASLEKSGMEMEANADLLEKEGIQGRDDLEEGQSDIQKMIAKYEAIRSELDADQYNDSIASEEIRSVEEKENARSGSEGYEKLFDPKKAIIYSEILKRKEY